MSKSIDLYISTVVESYIYKEIINYWEPDEIGSALRLKEKFTTRFGKLNGLYQSWHQNGQKIFECVYKEGKREGLCQWWYDNGQKM